jgi:hypothetical protein
MKNLAFGGIVAVFLASAPSAWAQYNSGNPTPAEQLVLELINRARANPTAEGTRLASFNPPLPGGDITEGLANPGNVGPRPPLAMNLNLLTVARAHSTDMYNRDYFAHDTKAPPTETWWQRINTAGYTGSIGENIAASSSATAPWLEDFLMVDWNPPFGGYPNRGHRVNLLDVDSAATPYREIGIGYHGGASQLPSGRKDFLTEDFGRNAGGPFIVGVVTNDTSPANSFYDIGEGLAGVTVRLNPAGISYAVTASAGGFAFPYAGTGNVTVEFTGGAFGAGVVSKIVNRTGENVKVDCKLSDMTDTDGDGLDDAWETNYFGNLAQTAAADPDLDTFSNLAEFLAGTDPTDPLSKPPPPSTGGGGGGGCGLSGLEAVLLLALLRFLVRR